MSNTIRFTSKEAFVAALEDRRDFWREYDKKQSQKHQADEKQWLIDARTKMREAIKMDYATLKAFVRNGYGDLRLGDAPRCPVLMESKIDTVLRSLNFTQSKAFTVDSKGSWDVAHHLLTHDPDAVTTVC